MKLGQLLVDRARTTPALEAIVDPEHRCTFQEFNHRVNQLANGLVDLGILAGDRVAILSKNRLDLMATYYAVWKIGAILVPLNTRLHIEELCYMLENCQAKAVIYDEAFVEYRTRMKEISSLDFMICMGNEKDSEDIHFDTLLRQGSQEEPSSDVQETDPAVIIYTSGTTGRPKGVIHSHVSLFESALGTLLSGEYREGDRFLCALPMFHISGAVTPLIGALHGITLVLLPEFHPAYTWEIIAKERITRMFAVPVMLNIMFQVPGWIDLDISSLRSISCGGTFVPEEMIRRFHEYGIHVLQIYGCTEHGVATVYRSDRMGIEKCHTAGKEIFFTQVKIVSPITGDVLPPGKVGEIALKRSHSFLGYWNNPEETAKVLKDGWFYTGDLGKIDEEGFLMIVDRLKDMFVCGGENVYPAEVEAILQAIEGVKEVAVIGVPDDELGEIPLVFIVKEPDSDLTQEDILKHCYGRLATFKCGKNVVFIDQMPRNAIGKIDKNVLREKYVTS
ncbi:class I adenylate-forming enzyme family protein [Thermoflavimicrobium dichotomicum]|uniref:Acyl-CoA synthetase (AMP-forming)/AMP-acid ligase II n=1 Tax=Thermoflavimicrobium dichotomicum TaxID=46223 RepID=A0A1I3RTC3_9BACL|nr:long-chain-fatty-acid--CoA ligase [Thermoflavimicrobium dichotomicum]SFJ49595.1 Acyl-CoA synthetase (AMP-forming)/AMP-acid ligase II [Thermoflavimicrobium dichotomicum]